MVANREFKFITQKFDIPHRFSSEIWEIRESVVLREEINSQSFVYGEIAPVPGFPNQPTIERVLHEAEIWKSHAQLPEVSALLPALSCMKSEIWKEPKHENIKHFLGSLLFNPTTSEDHHCVKRKIGIMPVKEEVNIVKQWLSRLEPNCHVRLDANGSLTIEEMKLWVDALANENRIQFLEQPLCDDLRDELFAFVKNSPIPLAIDETIVALGNPYVALENGWTGQFVIKPTLLNDWNASLDFVKEYPTKAILSTAFESPFGYEALIRACRFSELAPGITRGPFSQLDTELSSHHTANLYSPSASQTELNELWSKII